MTENKSSKSPEQDSNLGLPDCESDTVVTQPRFLRHKCCVQTLTTLYVTVYMVTLFCPVRRHFAGSLAASTKQWAAPELTKGDPFLAWVLKKGCVHIIA